MEAFTTHTGVAAVLDRANVDTDQIIPKQFLKSIKRTGFDDGLFFDWRYLPDGSLNPAFELNQPAFEGASILITGNNFGCGSSREHAVWAVAQYGFRALIAPWSGEGDARVPGFADIFRNNCGKNGILAIDLPPEQVAELMARVEAAGRLTLTIDLEAQIIRMAGDDHTTYPFDVAPSVRANLLQGLDEIALTLENANAITSFEATHSVQLDPSGA
jgi:3-isopropylmalate/(R)-2-methylmalate dehydratase small subunit